MSPCATPICPLHEASAKLLATGGNAVQCRIKRNIELRRRRVDDGRPTSFRREIIGTVRESGIIKECREDFRIIRVKPLCNQILAKLCYAILNPTTLHEKAVQLFTWITFHDKTPLYKFDGINKWFTNQAISDLSRIRAGIIAEETIEYRRFFWASFCEVVRIVSNSRDCTYKLHIKEKKDIDAYAVDAVDLFKTTLHTWR